jgi:hypothetical protein
MTCTLNTVVICDGAAYAGTAGKHIGPMGDGTSEVTWLVQESTPVGAAARVPYDRGNGSYAFDLETYVEFATESAATTFRLTWAASLPRTAASLVVVHDGGTTQTFTPAVLEKLRIAQSGLACVCRYEFRTGAPV